MAGADLEGTEDHRREYLLSSLAELIVLGPAYQRQGLALQVLFFKRSPGRLCAMLDFRGASRLARMRAEKIFGIPCILYGKQCIISSECSDNRDRSAHVA